MSSRILRATLLLTVLGGPAAAQHAAMQARADSLLRDWREARALADLQDSLRRTAQLAGGDTVRVGALRILANPSPLPVRQAAALAWPGIEQFYGPAADAFRHRPFLLNAVDPDSAAGPPKLRPGLLVTWDLDARRLAGLLRILADLSPEDPALRAWLGGPLLPPDSMPTTLRGGAYIQLVIAPSIVARRCLTGEAAACRQALTLDSADDPARAWYGPDGRRHLVVADFAGAFDRGARQREWRACRDGSDSTCLELLQSLPPGSVPNPLDYASRLSFLEFARQVGGPETFQRLFATPSGPMGARLAAATRVSADSLVLRWRTAVLAARPRSVSLPPWEAWLALGWVGVFATCGLRSSRWRIG
jgi:hypothetical protein